MFFLAQKFIPIFLKRIKFILSGVEGLQSGVAAKVCPFLLPCGSKK
jgi:hypothetical protein